MEAIKILVTGAEGQLGSSFKKYLSIKNAEVLYTDKSSLDINNSTEIERLWNDFEPDVLINCAAYTAVDRAESEEELAYMINEKAVEYLAGACEKSNSLFIHYSTDYVYHNGKDAPIKETDPTTPQGVYAHSKLAGEKKIIKSNCDSIIIRSSWIYSEYGNNFMKTMIRLSSLHPELRVVNDQIGSPTYARDIVDATSIMIGDWVENHRPKTKEIYNLSNIGFISWYDFAKEIFALSHININVKAIPTSEYPTDAVRPLWSVLDMNKISNRYDISLRNWKSSLKEAISKL